MAAVAFLPLAGYFQSMLYTRKGDGGTTKTFRCDQRISKNSITAEALGALDEINSFLGVVKVCARRTRLLVPGTKIFIDGAVHDIQKDLFIAQAELAGAPKRLTARKVKTLEKIADAVERELPRITTFFISGGTELAALFDTARTLSRRAERRAVAAHEAGDAPLSAHTLAYLNRLSSALYALARLANHASGIAEQAPDYR